MTTLTKFTYDDIMKLQPCYDPIVWIPKTFKGNAMDIFATDAPVKDMFWLILRDEFIPENVLHEFACDCAERVLHIFEEHYPKDSRPRQAIEAKRAWLRGEITDSQLYDFKKAAYASASAAYVAVVAAAYVAVAAAYVAADVASAYTTTAAVASAPAGAYAAAEYAAAAYVEYAEYAAYANERAWQHARLIELLSEVGE